MTGRVLAMPASRPRLDGWRAHGLALAGVAATLMLLFRADAAAMARIWWGTSTYEHCLAIPFVLAWLVWGRRDMLGGITPRGWAPPLSWVALGALGWLAGDAAGVAVARHLGLTLMVQGAVAALLGRAATRVLLFPLAYATFLVPAGDGLMPALQTITARMCMALLHLARIPAAIDGVFITTPGGWFEVAEACSGAKFVVAMAALAVLVAHLGFRAWPRRIAFVVLALGASIAANGVRAFATIAVAQWIGAERAGGVDHIVYGWVFFATVIAIVLAVAWRFFDRPADAPPADPAAVARAEARPGRTLPLAAACAATLAIAAAAPAWAMLARGGRDAPIGAVSLPVVPGWAATPPSGDWRPRFDDADRLIRGRYRRGDDTVDVAVAIYARQGDGRTIVGTGHGAADPNGPWIWAADVPAAPGWRGERLAGPASAARIAWTRYAIAGRRTGSPAQVKLATLRQHLLGGDQRATATIVSAPDAAAVARFAAALG